uniref:Uncharacterized protein n=1 Tax=Meloidogyne enterolobii TaxID=390850 RepID=A0A6V7XPV4_MELEN|nr:unnamed protein product [Meloidogyne enterolobii]
MVVDQNLKGIIFRSVNISTCLACAIFLLILIRPLYKFSKERTALFILFSKTCGNLLYQFLQIFVNICFYFPSTSAFMTTNPVTLPTFTILTVSIYIHITVLAVNRFHAVYFPFNYQQMWDKKYVKSFNKLFNHESRALICHIMPKSILKSERY